MTRTKRYMIYSAVVVLMAASIAVAGFIGPIVVSVALDVMARRKKGSLRSKSIKI